MIRVFAKQVLHMKTTSFLFGQTFMQAVLEAVLLVVVVVEAEKLVRLTEEAVQKDGTVAVQTQVAGRSGAEAAMQEEVAGSLRVAKQDGRVLEDSRVLVQYLLKDIHREGRGLITQIMRYGQSRLRIEDAVPELADYELSIFRWLLLVKSLTALQPEASVATLDWLIQVPLAADQQAVHESIHESFTVVQ